MSPSRGGGTSNRRHHHLRFVKNALATLIVFYGLLHLQFQQWLDDDLHRHDTPSAFRTTSLGGAADSVTLRRPTPTSSVPKKWTLTPVNATINKAPTLDVQSQKHQQQKKKRKQKNVNPPVRTEFVHQDGVAIVTKIHGPHQWALVLQSLCLFHHSYNQRLLYDIVIFTAEPIDDDKVASLQALIAPVNVQVVLDNQGLQKEIAAIPSHKRQKFLDQCRQHNQMETASNAVMAQNLTWFSDCGEGRLAYNWQAEFRSIHIWNHPVLQNYQWMYWMDTDAFCTKKWDRDPIAFAIHHKLAIFFDNFPGGGSRELATRIADGFNVTLCKVRVTPQGEMESTLGTVEDARSNEHCNSTQLRSIYGFLHITNLDFYRSPAVQHGIKALMGDSFLARDPDDQQAVTIPAAVLAPERSWDMRKKGIQLDVFHNLHIDGKTSEKVKLFKEFWKTSTLWEQMRIAQEVCPVTENK